MDTSSLERIAHAQLIDRYRVGIVVELRAVQTDAPALVRNGELVPRQSTPWDYYCIEAVMVDGSHALLCNPRKGNVERKFKAVALGHYLQRSFGQEVRVTFVFKPTTSSR